MLFDLHIHSKYSYDSVSKVDDILKVAKRRGLSGIAITDHESFDGSLEASAKAKHWELLVIPGMEVATEHGDVIGLFLIEEIKKREFFEVVNEIRGQGGMVVLPHPYRTFNTAIPFQIIARADVVEGFNARMPNDLLNRKAKELAAGFKKPLIGGSDAHFASEIGNGRTVFNAISLCQEDIKKALIEGTVELEGDILPFPLYVLYEFGVGRALRFIKSLGRT